MSDSQHAKAELEGRGYHEVADHPRLAPGTRVRHAGEQYILALDNGTAEVKYVMQRDGQWAADRNRPDIEVVVQRDDETTRVWADYRTMRVVVW